MSAIVRVLTPRRPIPHERNELGDSSYLEVRVGFEGRFVTFNSRVRHYWQSEHDLGENCTINGIKFIL